MSLSSDCGPRRYAIIPSLRWRLAGDRYGVLLRI